MDTTQFKDPPPWTVPPAAVGNCPNVSKEWHLDNEVIFTSSDPLDERFIAGPNCDSNRIHEQILYRFGESPQSRLPDKEKK